VDIITSRRNQLIQHIASLRDRKNRYAHQLFIAEGERACKTLVQTGVILHHALCTREQATRADEIFAADLIVVSDDVMYKISDTKTPSGLLGVFGIPAAPTLDKLTAGLVLAHVTNPGNMGTLMRTAAAIGVSSVVCVEGCDPWSAKVVSASGGTIGMLQLFIISWHTLLQHRQHIPLCALVVEGGNTMPSTNVRNSLLVVGNEAHGIPPAWQKDCTEYVTLPMPGGTESLNVAVAGSIALYEAYICSKRNI
jgi:TrmH family RNA methyltransferase